MASTKIIESFTAIPTNMIMPMYAMMFNGFPRKKKIKIAAGYGVFSNANLNIIFASVGDGYGIIVDNETGKETFMKMGMGGLGLGLGVKDYRSDKVTPFF